MTGKVDIVPHTTKVQTCHLWDIYLKNLEFSQECCFYVAPFFNTVCYNENIHMIWKLIL